MSLILNLKRDIWQLLAEYLSNNDLLSVRACCKQLNTIIISMNVRWYQEHQWFVKKYIGHHKVKSRIRIHTYKYSWRCVPKNDNLSLYDDTVRRSAIFKTGVDVSNCNRKKHTNWRSSKSKKDIPLNDKNFKINKHSYMYSYLIECYRYHDNQTKHMVAKHTKIIDKSYSSIVTYKANITFTESRIKKHKRRVNKIKRKRYKNDVFENVKRIDTYGKNKKIKK